MNFNDTAIVASYTYIESFNEWLWENLHRFIDIDAVWDVEHAVQYSTPS